MVVDCLMLEMWDIKVLKEMTYVNLKDTYDIMS